VNTKLSPMPDLVMEAEIPLEVAKEESRVADEAIERASAIRQWIEAGLKRRPKV
jgi:hypothetical protein